MQTLTTASPRHRLLAGAAATLFLGTLLTGCTSSDDDASDSTKSATATSTATSSATSEPSSTATASGTSAAAAANTFAATLTSDQKSAIMQDYTLANAEKWSNLPQQLSNNRIGLQTSSLSDSQWTALDTLLKQVTGTASGEGYEEIQQLLNADDYLEANGGGSSYGRGNYFIAFLGTPSDSGTWELQFGGHHTAVANTYIDGKLVGATPSFRGVEPLAEFSENGTSDNDPLGSELAAFQALLKGMSSTELSSANLSAVYSDLVLTPGKDWAFPTTKEGVKASTFTAAQKKLLVAAMATYVDDIDDADAATILADYTDDLDSTYVAYSGTTALTTQNDYVRIDGPKVWIEFSMQRGIVLSGNHPHSVWRDRTTDYGGTKS